MTHLYGVTVMVDRGARGRLSYALHPECKTELTFILPPSVNVRTIGPTETDPGTVCALTKCGRPLGEPTGLTRETLVWA